jgi:glycerol dehydrogenase-like iron-containing ADH family enzyme
MIVQECGQHLGESVADLGPLLDALHLAKVMLVLDRGAAKATGMEGTLRDALGDRLLTIFEDFTPNPSSDQPLKAARAALAAGAEGLVAFGGGSCLDVAKVGSLAAGSPVLAEEIVRGRGITADLKPLPVVAIPTTSGTGSEATHFAAIYVDGHKVSIAHPLMRPRGVILDARLHAGMPMFVAATTGLDAFCQATESLWAVGATPESRTDALYAQAHIVPHLAPSVLTANIEHRRAMMLGAHYAGRAINVSKTTAAHALSYELTTRFGVAHGLAVALTLGHIAAFNAQLSDSDCTSPKGSKEARASVHQACSALASNPAEMPEAMRSILRTLGLPASLREAGVTSDSLVPMAEAADTVRLSNNPRRLSTRDALEILTSAF